VASARKRSNETSRITIPRKMFTGRLRVGARTMRMGFMMRAVPLSGCRKRGKGRPVKRA
jgi:hypothetical protein